jgi:hypothetical protein
MKRVKTGVVLMAGLGVVVGWLTVRAHAAIGWYVIVGPYPNESSCSQAARSVPSLGYSVSATCRYGNILP